MEEVFNNNPSAYVDMNDLFKVLNDKVGLTSLQWQKAIENMNYLYNHLGLADVEIGNVSTVFTAPATLSDVEVKHREVETAGKTTDYFDFIFYIPSPKIEAELIGETTTNIEEVGINMVQTPIYGTGANSSTIVGYKFTFNAKFLAMDIPITTTITETSTDTEVPSAKSVFDFVSENAGGGGAWIVEVENYPTIINGDNKYINISDIKRSNITDFSKVKINDYILINRPNIYLYYGYIIEITETTISLKVLREERYYDYMLAIRGLGEINENKSIKVSNNTKTGNFDIKTENYKWYKLNPSDAILGYDMDKGFTYQLPLRTTDTITPSISEDGKGINLSLSEDVLNRITNVENSIGDIDTILTEINNGSGV